MTRPTILAVFVVTACRSDAAFPAVSAAVSFFNNLAVENLIFFAGFFFGGFPRQLFFLLRFSSSRQGAGSGPMRLFLQQWPSIFNNDSTIASAVLDRLLHHAETVVIEGSSYRMKDQIES